MPKIDISSAPAIDGTSYPDPHAAPCLPRRRKRLGDAAGLTQLKGHKSVGGMRASIYNAVPLAGVSALVEYLKEFERRYG